MTHIQARIECLLVAVGISLAAPLAVARPARRAVWLFCEADVEQDRAESVLLLPRPFNARACGLASQ